MLEVYRNEDLKLTVYSIDHTDLKAKLLQHGFVFEIPGRLNEKDGYFFLKGNRRYHFEKKGWVIL